MSTEAGIDVQRQLESLIQDFRTSDPPMPVIVLHAEDAADDDRVTELVDELREGQQRHGTRLAVAPTEPQPGALDPTARAARLLCDLGDPRKWGDRSATYRPYAFPRLNLVRALQEATDDPEMREHWPIASTGTPDGIAQREEAQTHLLRILARQRWRPRRPSRRPRQALLTDVQQFLPMGVLGAFTALLTRPEWYVAALAGIGLMVLLAVLNHVPGRAPLFLWLRRESRWFLTTTFLQSAARRQSTSVRLLRPVRSWRAIAARAYDVAEAMREGGPFPLQLYVLALFEDLRDNHRRGSWDLRGFKRTRPPVLLLHRIGRENGGIELIKAVSDVRSRRSELDPLLIVAGVAADDAPLLDRGEDADPPTGRPQPPLQQRRLQQRLRHWYDEWAGNLRADQSPSRTNALPWVLRIPLPAEELVQLRQKDWRCVRAGNRPPLARVVWSAHSLALVMVLAATAAVVHSRELHHTYCSAGLLTAARDTERHPAPGGGTECVGIATGDVRFGAYLEDGADEEGERLRTLEDLVRAENTRVLRRHPGTYVTVVYAGPMSSSTADPSLVKGNEELAGVYLAQRVVNANYKVKLRVLLANGGADMGHQRVTAEAIADYADRDPTVVGVVGFGRDLQSSPDVTRRLHAVGLPVVSGTNSATYLPEDFSNWFSLAAPDEHQAEALGLVARQLRPRDAAPYALVLARDTEESQDRYTSEQATYGGRMLQREGYRMLPAQTYRVANDNPELRLHAESICRGKTVPSVIYFAGRVEDIGSLMTQLSTEPGCANREISILTGDDLSKARFSDTGGRDGVAPRITLYHAALAELREAAAGTDFYNAAAKYLPWLEEGQATYDATGFASGQTALSHDATRALYWAASLGDEPQSRAATWVNLRGVKLDGMATGRIDFTDAPLYGERRGHSIVLKRVRRTADGVSQAEVLCSRPAGGIEPLSVKECAIR
ncbi:ABC transporter substrate-binding protein [Streptomyces capillispiralis]|uniref:ABC-type branched-subunit amino acid transport system substrate-binding protein n=1 Tax=Streptomyces capillispiralis TaxID=68182 RepID=A0A561T9Y6_9ACTN|nr:ABC transporter substrate-binding protein [Streptomyces capillispiralis]TWF83938.1 ABC-type branched-subunit amino acid transport system substrate-binding protein [Streptomyces capillispiralis]